MPSRHGRAGRAGHEPARPGAAAVRIALRLEFERSRPSVEGRGQPDSHRIETSHRPAARAPDSGRGEGPGPGLADSIGVRRVVRATSFGVIGVECPLAASQGPALRQQARPRRPVDGAVHAPAAEEAGVRGVHDRVDREGRDVGGGDGESRVRHGACWSPVAGRS